jgi:hypothetical protein
MLGTSVAPRKAEAIVGIATFNVSAIVLGGFLTLEGGAGLLWNATTRCRGRVCNGKVLFDAFAGSLAALGILLLDAEDPSSLRFQALSESDRITIGVSASDYQVYAAELEEINAAWDEGARQAVVAEVRTAEQARQYFAREFAHLSPETRTVMSQVARHAAAGL